MTALLEVRRLALPEVRELVPRCFGDSRGSFREVYNRKRFAAETGIAIDFLQSNQSSSTEAGTLRGLHYQAPPFAQAKLVWVVRGAIFDVAVDIRAGSATFGRWAALELSAEKGNQILVPAGFAHGFLTLTPDTSVQYMVDAHYAPEHEGGIRFDDPDLAIDWPLAGAPKLSERDEAWTKLADAGTPFRFEERAA